ncbi:MAG: hypothetical protein H6696_05980 [Deferribacteres bacterium]|nr:hypothetical protein [candidate division KSB1 bacterium]MCB9501466.1 hypothetical protein [Deferribacteres bacterium]
MSWFIWLFKNKLFKETFISVLDQGLLSATNFTINLLLIRNALPSEYGAYTLAFSTILLMVGMQNALVVTPMIVLGPKREPEARAQFVGDLLSGQYVLWLPASILAFIGSYFLQYVGFDSLEISVIRVGSATVLFVLLREFFRRVFFLYLYPKTVLLVDFIYSATFIATIVIAINLFEISALLALTSMFFACLVVVPISLFLSRKSVQFSFSWRPGVLMETWVHGKFAIMGVIFTWLHNRAFLFLLSGIKDNAAVADIDSIRLIYMPIQIVMTSIASILKPRGAAILAENAKMRFFKVSSIYMLLTIGGAFFYITIMLLTFDMFAVHLFKRAIDDSSLIVLLWGIKFGLHACLLILTVSYQVLERFKTLFRVGAVAAFVSVISTWWGIVLWEAPGSLFGPIAGEICYVVLLLYLARRDIITGVRGLTQGI